MTGWVLAIWIGGGLLVLAGIVLIVHALFADRSRGRRRCRKCWYNMLGAPGMTCPECGHTAHLEKEYFRTHRHRKRIVLGVALALLGAAGALSPAIYTGNYLTYVPHPILRYSLAQFEEEADAAYKKHSAGMTGTVQRRGAGRLHGIGRASGATPAAIQALSAWQRLLLAQGCVRQSGRSDSTDWLSLAPETILAMLSPDERNLVLPALIRQIDSPDGSKMALRLSRFGGDLPEKPLIQIVKRSQYERARLDAVRLLLSSRDASALPVFRHAAEHDQSADIRALAIFGLTRRCADVTCETDVLIKLLDDDVESVGLAAMAVITERSGAPDAFKALPAGRMSSDRLALSYAGSARRLTLFGTPQPLEFTYFHDDGVNACIDLYLSTHASPEPVLSLRLVEPLIRQLRHAEPVRRQLASMTLKQFAGEARPALEQLRTSCDAEPNENTSWAMLDAIAAIAPELDLKPHLARFIERSESPEYTMSALERLTADPASASPFISSVRLCTRRNIVKATVTYPILRDIGDPNSPAIQQMLDDPNPSVRLDACVGIAAAGYACDYTESLTRLLKTDEPWVRGKAAEALALCSDKALDTIRLFGERLAVDRDTHVQLALLDGVGKLSRFAIEDGVGTLASCLHDQDLVVQHGSVQQLEALAKAAPLARRTLQEAARSDNLYIRGLARESLSKLGAE